MKIGIWLGKDLIDSIGGGASYSNRFLHLVDDYNFTEDVEICYLTLVPQCNLNKKSIYVSQFPGLLYRLLRRSAFLTNILKRFDCFVIKKRGLASVLNGTHVEVVCYYRQMECIDPNYPFVLNNWDIGHRSTHMFPEFANKDFLFRDHFYRDILPKSLLTICESETGKCELMRYANIGSHKIRILPLFAGGVSSLNVSEERMNSLLEQIGVKKHKYFYYPAQFWAHKNHIGLLKAFREYRKTTKDHKLVFSGSDQGNKAYIIKKSQELGLIEDVIFLDFIPEESVYALYKNAICLVMASHFGPTNMPPIEAMELSCPVACSDLGGHHEILGDSAVYFNSYDYMSICQAMLEIEKNREEWIKKIDAQNKISIFKSKYAMKRFNDILSEAVVIRENWGDNY